MKAHKLLIYSRISCNLQHAKSCPSLYGMNSFFYIPNIAIPPSFILFRIIPHSPAFTAP